MNKKFIEQIKTEIILLESWIRTSENGGWSSYLVAPMKERVMELKAFLYDFENGCDS
jgi:hypothetical protein